MEEIEIIKDDTMSPSIAKLADALSQAQGELTGAIKDSSNPFFKSKYADLAAVQDAIRGPFSKHGLAYIQTNQPTIQGYVSVQTLLAHKSGEWIRGTLILPMAKPDAQGAGSAITYARRYALAAIAGIAQIDDDGNAASHLRGEVQGTKIDIQKLDAIVEEAIVVVDECDDDPETGAKRARELYEGLVNDERVYVNGRLQERKFKNESTGRENGYWPAFKKHLLHAAEIS